MCIINVYSRYVQAVALTNRRGETILEAVKKIFGTMGTPKNLNADNEFNTKDFNDLMAKDGVHLWFSDPDEINKNAIVERFNRTLAALLQRVRVGTGSYDWAKYLPDVIENYNNSYHSTIYGKPIDVFKGTIKNLQTEVHLTPVFQVGDNVRTKLRKGVFAKGDELTYSKTVYAITALKGARFELKNLTTNEVLKTLYKSYEISKVGEVQHLEKAPEVVSQETEHKVIQANKKLTKKNKQAGVDTSKVVDEKREVKPTEKVPQEYIVEKITEEAVDANTGRKIYKVHWKGYPADEATWESYNNVRATEAYAAWLKARKANTFLFARHYCGVIDCILVFGCFFMLLLIVKCKGTKALGALEFLFGCWISLLFKRNSRCCCCCIKSTHFYY